MLIKHSGRKSIGILLKSKSKHAKKLSACESSKKTLKLKPKCPDSKIKIPRTCLDSPIESKSKKACKRLTSCDTYNIIPTYKYSKSIKKTLPKEKTLKKKKKNSNDFAIEKILISPIKKIKMDFLNKEDQSIMKVLEII